MKLWKRAVGYATRIVGKQDAEDIVNGLVVEILEKGVPGSYPKNGGEHEAFLFGMLRFRCLSLLGWRMKEKIRTKQLSDSLVGRRGVASTVVCKDLVQAWLEKLPPTQQQIVMLRHGIFAESGNLAYEFDNVLTFEKIGGKLNISRTLVFREYHTAEDTLRRML